MAASSELPAVGAGVDGVVTKPTSLEQAKAVIERCIRVRLPKRVLVVDDSATMRSIVRKLLSASRFRLEIAEAQEGIEALKQIGAGKFDFVFLDYNMPGLNGVETLSEIKRQYPRTGVVIMTSTQDDAVAERARVAGAAAFLKKPFYAADIDAVLNSVYGLRTSKPSWRGSAGIVANPRRRKSGRCRPVRSRRGRTRRRRNPACPCSRRRSRSGTARPFAAASAS